LRLLSFPSVLAGLFCGGDAFGGVLAGDVDVALQLRVEFGDGERVLERVGASFAEVLVLVMWVVSGLVHGGVLYAGGSVAGAVGKSRKELRFWVGFGMWVLLAGFVCWFLQVGPAVPGGAAGPFRAYSVVGWLALVVGGW
jgi:hypothetical protein